MRKPASRVAGPAVRHRASDDRLAMSWRSLVPSALATTLLATSLLSGCGPSSAGPAPTRTPGNADPSTATPATDSRGSTEGLDTRPLDPVLAQAIRRLGDSDRTDRSRAAALLRDRTDEASPALRTLAADAAASDVARALAVRILSEHEPDAGFFCSLYTQSHGKVALEALDALTRCGVDAVPCLVDALDRGTAADRAAVVRTLVAIGEPAIPLLLAGSTDPAIDRRVGACAALARLVTPDSPHATVTLRSALACLDDDEEIARRTGRDLIVSLGDLAIPSLVARIRDAEHPHREFVATTLAATGSTAFASLVELSNDASPEIRRLAFHGFGGWTDWNDESIDAVTDGFTDPDVRVRHAALLTIRGEADTWIKRAIPALIDVLASNRLEERRIAESALIAIGPAVGHRLPRVISGGTETQRLHAARIAGRLAGGADSCIPALESLHESTEDDALRNEVDTALRRIRKKAERR